MLASVAALALTGVLAACGGGANAASPSGGTTAPAGTTPAHAGPRIAEASVAAAPEDDEATTVFGAAAVASAYTEMVALATKEALDPAYFAWTGRNTTDLLEPVFTRLAPEIRDDTKRKAQECLDFVHQSCMDINGLAFYDLGTDYERFTYRSDRRYVTQQSVTAPTASVQSGTQTRLVLTFDHVVTIELAMNGKPVEVRFTRQLTYYLVPAPAGTAHQWLISAYHVNVTAASMTDPATGQPVPEPTDPAAPSS